MTELLTEKQIRQMAFAALHPGPWEHKIGVMDAAAYERGEFICLKCLQPKPEWKKHCRIPDPDPREFPVIVADLVPKVTSKVLLAELNNHFPIPYDRQDEEHLANERAVQLLRFIRSEAIKQAEILLRALKVEVPHE